MDTHVINLHAYTTGYWALPLPENVLAHGQHGPDVFVAFTLLLVACAVLIGWRCHAWR